MSDLLPITEQATCRFDFTAGRLVARQVRVGVRTIAHHHGVRIELEEDVGWCDTTFFATATGTSEQIANFWRDIQNNFTRWSGDDK